MSLLNSILSSIGDDGNPVPASTANSRTPPPVSKRKAEHDLTSGPAKRPVTPNNNTQTNLARRPPAPATASAGGEYKGSARPPGASSVSKPNSNPAPKLDSKSGLRVETKPVPKLDARVQAERQPTTPTTTKAAQPAPKKGSYLDILARAKAKKEEIKAPIGVITHGKSEKPRKERLAEATAKGKSAPIQDGKSLSDRSRTGSAEAVKLLSQHNKEKRKQKEIAYRNAKSLPAVSTYKGTAALGRLVQTAKQPRGKAGQQGSWSDGDDLGAEDEEDEGDYASDVSSDMEAGAFDIDNEEELALRAAKAEDAKELALENELKLQKMARLQKLEKMAAAKKKPGSGY